MKFTKELKLNSIEEWRNAYLNYAALKKTIFTEEKRQVVKASTLARKSGESSTLWRVAESVLTQHQWGKVWLRPGACTLARTLVCMHASTCTC